MRLLERQRQLEPCRALHARTRRGPAVPEPPLCHLNLLLPTGLPAGFFPLSYFLPVRMWCKVGWAPCPAACPRGLQQPLSCRVPRRPTCCLPPRAAAPPQVHNPSRRRVRVLWIIGAILAVVTLAAIVGSVQSLIDAWSSGFTLFD